MKPLTRRQRQVLELLAEGNTYGDVATLIGISRNTVIHHVAAMLERLQARNTTHAVAKWARGEVPA